MLALFFFFFFQAEDGIRDLTVTGVQTCALPISSGEQRFLADVSPTLADYFLLPTLTSLGFAPEGKQLLERFPRVGAWVGAMGELAAVKKFRASLPPRTPIEHARRWAAEHRAKV